MYKTIAKRVNKGMQSCLTQVITQQICTLVVRYPMGKVLRDIWLQFGLPKQFVHNVFSTRTHTGDENCPLDADSVRRQASQTRKLSLESTGKSLNPPVWIQPCSAHCIINATVSEILQNFDLSTLILGFYIEQHCSRRLRLILNPWASLTCTHCHCTVHKRFCISAPSKYSYCDWDSIRCPGLSSTTPMPLWHDDGYDLSNESSSCGQFRKAITN